MMTITGSSPRSFPVGERQCHNTLRRVYGHAYVGKGWHEVREGEVLVIPEHGGWESGPQEVRHEFPAGTRFRLIRVGDPHTLSITEVDCG